MMTISESQYTSNKMSSVHRINDRIVHRDDYNDNSLVTNRGFKPSDMYDPQKKEFLTNLSYKLFPVSMDDLDQRQVVIGDKEVDLNKLFTPAPDAEEHLIKKGSNLEKTFASSAFYVPGVHPTVKQQMDLARSISKSLSDSSNQMSRGQSMYVNRKKRSVKWVHEGRGRNTSNTCSTPTPVASHDTHYRPPSSGRTQKTYPKSALKNTIPKYEPPRSPHIDVPIHPTNGPIHHTKLNDVYSAPKSPRSPLSCGPNFNMAPRGWGQMNEYYRPVALDGIGRSPLPYTDY